MTGAEGEDFDGSTNEGAERSGTTPDELSGESEADTEEAGPETESDTDITPQSPALRRQQYVVGIGAAVLAGFALAVSSFQHYPGLPNVVPVAAGIVGGGVVYWIVTNSLFPTQDDLATE